MQFILARNSKLHVQRSTGCVWQRVNKKITITEGPFKATEIKSFLRCDLSASLPDNNNMKIKQKIIQYYLFLRILKVIQSFCSTKSNLTQDKALGRKLEIRRWTRWQNRQLAKALIPDGKLNISEPEAEPVKYSREDRNLINDLGGKRASWQRGARPDGHTVMPFSILWEWVPRKMIKRTRGTDTTKDNPSTRNRAQVGLLGKGAFWGNNGKLISRNSQEKGGIAVCWYW